jgi:tetratricopeptide (TPR) repeat protein
MIWSIPTRKMASSLKLWAACIVLALVVAAPARAQTAAGEALFASGRQAYRDGRFEAAAHDFAEAYRLDHLPGLLFNQALALRKLWLVEARPDALERAVAAYREYLRDWPTGPRRNEAVEALTELAPQLERLRPTPPPVDDEPENPPQRTTVTPAPIPITPPNTVVPPPVIPRPAPAPPPRRRAWVWPVVYGSLGGAALLAVAIGVGVTFTRSISSTESPSLGTVFW